MSPGPPQTRAQGDNHVHRGISPTPALGSPSLSSLPLSGGESPELSTLHTRHTLAVTLAGPLVPGPKDR